MRRKSSGNDDAGRTGVRYIRRNFDEAAILAVALKLAFERDAVFSESEQATILAMQRAHPRAGDSTEELGEWLRAMEPEQLAGVVSNTKGVLHEMEFVSLENGDGDSVHAALFGSANQAGYDVQFVDHDSGMRWDAQLKASDDAGYIQDWINTHPDGEIRVTDEIAATMGLPSSGLSNEELSVRTEDLVDRLLTSTDDDTLWNYFPALTAASVGLVTWELWQRVRRGEITPSRFKRMLARATGLKAGKLALLCLAMSIPGLNVVTGAALAARLILAGLATGRSSYARRPISSLLPRPA